MADTIVLATVVSIELEQGVDTPLAKHWGERAMLRVSDLLEGNLVVTVCSAIADEQVQPVSGLVVTARPSTQEYRAQTAEDGTYEFRDLPRGTYKMSVKALPGGGRFAVARKS
jgi:hypothetical protein